MVNGGERAIEDFICFGKPTDTLIPDPEDCGSYFICDGGIGKRSTCHPGIFFNPILGQCDPNYKDCNGADGGGAETSPITPSFPFTSSPTNSTQSTFFPTPPLIPVWSTTTATPQIEKKCPENDTKTLTFLPSYEYCDRFFLCYYGKAIQFDCSGGYHWSQSKNACVPPHQSECQVLQ